MPSAPNSDTGRPSTESQSHLPVSPAIGARNNDAGNDLPAPK
jgi:hypothetical protein